MLQTGWNPSEYGLEKHGIHNVDAVYWNMSTGALYEMSVRRREGLIAHLGPLVVRTGSHTGRSPMDKFIVKEPSSEKNIWWGKENIPFEEKQFDQLYARLLAYIQGRELFVQDCFAGADPKYQIPIRVITEDAWHSLFARNMFIRPDWEKVDKHVPEFAILNVPQFHAVPQLDGTNSEAFIIVHFGKKLIIIGGTSYAGEIKKSVFTIMNYILPLEKVLSMHCAANVGGKEDAAIFFGLSGTGKTALSSDPQRRLIGDDEHGWSDKGIFNFEGGCYAKAIRLSRQDEPQIYETTRRFGTILENVAINMVSRRLNLDDNSLTENTRAAYPITHIENAVFNGLGGHPENIFMLTYDAFGVLPPISLLTPEQAMYHFLSGYTSKVGGTEKGMGEEPQAVFSSCFGAPFMALHPTVYAQLLREKIIKHKAQCWLVNTGLSGGPYGVGKRVNINHTRAMVRCALAGELLKVDYEVEPFFAFKVPKSCPNVPSNILQPKSTWTDQAAYDARAKEVAAKFRDNFQEFATKVDNEIVNAGPK